MPERERFDVIVVGGGPAGAVAATLLARGGARVALLERAPGPVEKICGEYVGPRAVQDLERLGFGSALRGVPTRSLTGMLMVAPDGSEVAADFVAPDGTRRFGLSIARKLLDGTLQEEARRSGAELHLGQTVGGIAVSSEGVVVRTQAEPQREWHARLLIGADGRFSSVAHALGLERRPTESRRRARRAAKRGVIHAWLRGVSGLCDRGEMHLLGDGSYLGLDPLAASDGRLNAGLVVAAAVVADAVRCQDGGARLLAAAASSPSLARRFARATIDGEVRYLAPMRTDVRGVVAERTLLVGDAAGFFDPLTGEGIALAIASAELAARAAQNALATQDEKGARAAVAIQAALAVYARDHARLVRSKKLLHPLLQGLLRRPALANRVGRALQSSPAAAQRLLAVIGNLRGPSALLHPDFWTSFLRRRRAPLVSAPAR